MPQYHNDHRGSLLCGGQLGSRLEGHWRDLFIFGGRDVDIQFKIFCQRFVTSFCWRCSHMWRLQVSCTSVPSSSSYHDFHPRVIIVSSSSRHINIFMLSSELPMSSSYYHLVIIIQSSCHLDHHLDHESFKTYSFLKRIFQSRQKFPLLEIVKYIQHKVATSTLTIITHWNSYFLISE